MIEISVVKFPENLSQYHLVTDYLRLRKKVFIENKFWDLHSSDEMEFDQYDPFTTTYVIAHQCNKVVGGVRLTRTNSCMSYMIRDAHLGLLADLPPELCLKNPPVDKDIWEVTRLVSAGRTLIGYQIIKYALEFLITKNAKGCLFLCDPSFIRISKKLGYDPKPLGPVCGNETGQFQAFECEF